MFVRLIGDDIKTNMISPYCLAINLLQAERHMLELADDPDALLDPLRVLTFLVETLGADVNVRDVSSS